MVKTLDDEAVPFVEPPRGRIDGMTALANAVGVMPAEIDKPATPQLLFF